MKKRIISVACVLAMLLSTVACGAPNATPQSTAPAEAPASSEAAPAASEAAPAAEGASGKLSFWNLWTTETDANARAWLTSVLPAYQAANPNVEIELDATENEAYKTKIKTAVAANEAPDVFFAWGGGFAKTFADADALLPLDDYIAKSGAGDKLMGGALANFTYNGKAYGLPFVMWVGSLFCNNELFEANGVAIPTNNDELLAAVKTFKEKGLVPITVGAKDGWPAMFFQNVYAVRSAGSELSNKALAGEASFDAPEFVQSAQLLKDLIDAGGFDPNCLALTADEAKMPFLAGEIPMWYFGSWSAGEIQDPANSQVVDKVTVANWPALNGGKGQPTEILGGSIDGIFVSKNTADPDLAFNFAAYVAENMAREGFKLGSGVPMWKIDMTGISVDPVTSQIVEIANKSTGSVLAWDTFLPGEAAEKHKSLVQEIFAGTLTPENFAKEMAALQTK